MSFFNKYPYTDLSQINLDWIISKVQELDASVTNFEALQKLTWAGEWNIGNAYAQWSIVQDGGSGYVAIIPVPRNVQITNATYWRKVADYDALYAAFEERISALETSITSMQNVVDRLYKGINNIIFTFSNVTMTDIESVTNVFDMWSKCGVKYYYLPVYIESDYSLRYSITDLKALIDIGITYGIYVKALKFHSTSSTTPDLATNSDSQSAYASRVISTISSLIASYTTIDTVIILNEREDVVITNNNDTWIVNLVNRIKNYVSNVSISFTEYSYITNCISNHLSVAQALTFYCSNYYPFVSLDGKYATDEEFKDAYNAVLNYARYLKSQTNKAFVISEFGCISYNEAIARPWVVNPSDPSQFPTGATYNPIIPIRMIDGLIHNNMSGCLKEAVLWFDTPNIFEADSDLIRFEGYIDSIVGGAIND